MKARHHYILFWLLLLLSLQSIIAQQNEKHVLIISGLGGSPELTERFHSYMLDTRSALVEQFNIPASQVTLLGGSKKRLGEHVRQVSTADNIRAAIADISRKIGAEDDLYIFLFGHGSFDGNNALLNIPRRDLKDIDYASLLNTISARSIVFVNTASCSGPFLKTLSGENRVIITATQSGRERNDTRFPKFMIEAFNSAAADLGKDGRLSVMEVFRYAASATVKEFVEANHLITENALLDDNGDGKGTTIKSIENAADGALAMTLFFDNREALPIAAGNIVLAAEKEQIEESIRSLQRKKSQYSDAAYLDLLEPLFVRLARINDQIEADGS